MDEISIQNPSFYWLDEDTFILAFNGGVDEDGDEYSYQARYKKSCGRFTFTRWYEADITPADFTPEQEEQIKAIMRENLAQSEFPINKPAMEMM